MTQRFRVSLRVLLLVVGGVAVITYLANAIRRDYLLDRAIRYNRLEELKQLSPLFPSDVRKLSHYMRSNDSVVASRVETMLTVAVQNRNLTENAARLLPTAPVRGRPPFGLLRAMAGNYGFDEQVRATVRRASTTFPTELATFEILASCGERQDLIRILNGAQAQEPKIRAFACHALYRLWWGPLVDREAELLDNEASGDVQRLLVSSLAKYWTTKSCQTIWQYVESNDNGLRLYALEQLLRSDVGLAFVEERRECVQRLKALADIDIVAVHHSAEVESRRRFWESLEHLALTEEFTSFHSNLSRVDGGRHGSERFCFSVLLFVRSKLEENVTQHRDMYWRVQEFLTPHELGTVTPLIRPVLREFVQHKIPELQFAGCKSMLLFGNLDDARLAAAVAVERLDGSEFGWRLEFLRLLANRFGNNFGFDRARWRTHIDEELSRWGVAR